MPATLSLLNVVYPKEERTRAIGSGRRAGHGGGRLDTGRSLCHELTPRLSTVPEPVRGPASDSLAKAIEVANKLGPQGKQLAEASKNAFLAGTQISTTGWQSSSQRARP